MTNPLDRAILLLEQGRYDLAERELRQALARDPDDPSLHALLAHALLRQGRLTEATHQAETAVRLDPEQPFGHYMLACALLERNRFEEADAALGQAIRLDAEDADAHGVQASIRLNQSRWHEALVAAERGLAVDPEHTGCANLRVVALRQLGRTQETRASLDRTLARDPENPFTHANRGWSALVEERDPREALEHFREALRLDPELDWAREGAVEALKARNAAYRLFLRYAFWAARLGARGRGLLLVGGPVLFNLLKNLTRSSPDLADLTYLAMGLYGILVAAAWFAEPLSTLLLRLDRFGRMLLSRNQIAESNWVGGCLLLALSSLVAAMLTGAAAAFVAAMLGLLLLFPLVGTFRCEAGWPRRAMAAYTALLAALGTAGLVLYASAPGMARPWSLAFVLLGVAFLGAIVSAWGTQALAGVRPRR